jgi:sortase B
MKDSKTKLKIWTVILLTVGVLLLAAGFVTMYFENTGRARSGARVIDDVSQQDSAKSEADKELQDDEENSSVTDGDNPDISNIDDSEGSEEVVEEIAEEVEEKVLIPNPYKDYFLENEDMAAWIVVPGTVIDYPVMWTPEDEEYYLKRDFNKKSSAAGCLLLDTDSCMDPLTDNLIIHGHNMKDGSMFGSLLKYEKEDYYEEHKYIHLYGKDYEHVYEVMAVFRSQVFYAGDTCFKFYKFFNAKTEEEFNDFYDNVKEMSVYDTGVTASFGDRFITLSTCAYHVDNGRFVVVAKEIEPGGFYEPFE